jgi:Spy/CpxP family protein refolding chaperone
MRRRELLAGPGVAGVAAFAAGRAFAQPREATAVGAAPIVSRKALIKETGAKAAYELPKTPTKQTRYLASITALLSLNSGQQQQAASIFTSAVTNRIAIHLTMKSARKVLSTAVKSNDSAGISQAASELGALTSQYIANGATANAAFYQILTPAQQATLTQYQGRVFVTQ